MEMGLRTRTALETAHWASARIISTRVCVPRVLTTGTIWGQRLFSSELLIVRLLFEGRCLIESASNMVVRTFMWGCYLIKHENHLLFICTVLLAAWICTCKVLIEVCPHVVLALIMELVKLIKSSPKLPTLTQPMWLLQIWELCFSWLRSARGKAGSCLRPLPVHSASTSSPKEASRASLTAKVMHRNVFISC